MKCRKCKGTMQDATERTASGTHGNVTVNLFDLSYAVCPQCGSKAFVHAEFPAEVLFPLTSAVPHATAKGFRTKEWSCVACRARIDPSQERVETFAVPLNLEGRYQFRAELMLPAVTCDACGRNQVAADERALDSDLADALIAAFDSVGPLSRW